MVLLGIYVAKIAILISTRDTVFDWVQAPPTIVKESALFHFCWGLKLYEQQFAGVRLPGLFASLRSNSSLVSFEKNKFQGFWQYIYVGTAKNSFTVKLFQDGNRDVTCFYLFVYLGEFIRF